MSYLPANSAILIVGGRNDNECKKLNTPFLNDIHLFLLDQKAWVSVKYNPTSERLYRMGNHSMCTITDGESYEKTYIFGGITESPIFKPVAKPIDRKKISKRLTKSDITSLQSV